jgi:hypothetical protein
MLPGRALIHIKDLYGPDEIERCPFDRDQIAALQSPIFFGWR